LNTQNLLIKKTIMEENSSDESISRKKAIIKISKYTALTALGTFLILTPARAQSSSISDEDLSGAFDTQKTR
jgi:hypothetical protein